MLTKDQIIQGFCSLSHNEQRDILSILLDNIDPEPQVDPETEVAETLTVEWREEIGRRLTDYRTGKVQGIPALVAQAEADAVVAVVRTENHAG